MKNLTDEKVPEFEAWLTARRPLGLSLTETSVAVNQLAIGDGTGQSWVVDPADKPLVDKVIRALAKSGRKVWSDLASRAAIRLARRQHIDVDEFTWLLDASTAWNVVHPEDSARDLSLKRMRKSLGAGRDAVATARLIELFQTTVAKPTRDAILDSCRQDQLWRHRQFHGWRVDLDLLAKELAATVANRDRSRKELGIDLTDTRTEASKAAIHAWLARADIRITDWKGNLTLERDVYDVTVIPETDFARETWATFRRVRSIASRSAKLWEIKRALVGDRIYGTISVRHALTGRAAIVKPALQNINTALRPLLIADPGHTLVALDYSQVEPRVAAGLSGDTALAKALLSGDVYAELARSIWGDAALDGDGNVRGELRSQSKTLLLGILYSKGRRQISIELGVTLEEAGVFLDGIWGSYPQLAAYNKRIQQDMARGVSELTATGRIVPKPPKGEHATLNNRTQAEASDVYTAGVSRVAAVVGTARLFMGIHDELVLMVPSNRTEWARAVLNEQMPTVFHGVPIIGEASVVGRAWRKV